MKTVKLMSIAVIFLFVTQANAQTIIKEKSNVSFEIRNMKVNTVTGTFTGMNGEIIFNKRDLKNAKFKVSIDASTVNTENEKRDKHLRNEDFFHVDKYPVIAYESGIIYKFKENFVTKGKLTMHGVTKDIMIPFTFDGTTFNGTFKLNRLDYGVGEGTSEFTVSNEVSLTIICVIE